MKKFIRQDDAERERGGEGGQWAVYFNSPQSFKIKFSYSLAKQLYGTFTEF